MWCVAAPAGRPLLRVLLVRLRTVPSDPATAVVLSARHRQQGLQRLRWTPERAAQGLRRLRQEFPPEARAASLPARLLRVSCTILQSRPKGEPTSIGIEDAALLREVAGLVALLTLLVLPVLRLRVH